MSDFYNPVKYDNSLPLIRSYAKQGLEKQLKKINKQIEKSSINLRKAHEHFPTSRRLRTLRLNHDAKCKERDEIEKALEFLEKNKKLFQSIRSE